MPSKTRGWDTYWRGARDMDSFSAGGAKHPAVSAFWSATLGKILATTGDARVLDIATGRGAVLENLIPLSKNVEISCVDISSTAIDRVQRRYPTVVGVVADARSIPLDSSRYDLITSQFGIEYAGQEAMDEAARLLAPGGTLVMLMHIHPGVIFDECSAALDAIRRTQRAKFIERALGFFEAGFAAVRGGDRASYEKAGLKLNPAIEAVDTILSEHGERVAGGAIAKLYFDVERIHKRIQTYDPDEVLDWLHNMDRELADYADRMASMCDAALDDRSFGALGERLQLHGLTMIRGEPLLPADGTLPVAWALLAVRAK